MPEPYRVGTDADSMAEEAAAVRHLVAEHYKAALYLGDAEEGHARQALGTPEWLLARWHLHMAQALQGLQASDHYEAIQWTREKTLNALAGKKMSNGS